MKATFIFIVFLIDGVWTPTPDMPPMPAPSYEECIARRDVLRETFKFPNKFYIGCVEGDNAEDRYTKAMEMIGALTSDEPS